MVSLPEDSKTKGKFKLRLGLLNDQQGSTLSDKEKLKGWRGTAYWKSIQKRQKDHRNLWRGFLESEVKTAVKLLGKNSHQG